ncbi:MAG TPA: glycosyltransferase family 39 protein [Tepidisphaeraceae bacterium]|nr:glycosyltransferase family 39 protein [Tepidisphaeraceae bacterium]
MRAIWIVVAFFVALAPTLVWQEFSSSPENLVVATSMEMRRGGPWLVPTLQGEPRIAKPPLAAWITAAAIRPQTMRDIDTLDHDIRENGFKWLAIETRWPALVSACLLLLGVFELGCAIGDAQLGFNATAIAATTYFLLRFSRYTTTDIQLALWVTWANVFLANAIIRRRYWSGFIGAGLMLGLAMMSKGPVGLIESVVPCAVFLGVRRKSATTWLSLPKSEATPPVWRALIVGFLLFLASGLWWYAIVLARNSDVVHRWFSEVTRIDATESAPGPIFTYLGIIGYVVPWTVFLFVGVIVIARQLKARQIMPDLLSLLLLAVPLIVMSFAKDRQDRYALPMIPAAAIVAAIGVREYLTRPRFATFIASLHWLMLAGIAIVVPLLGTTPLLKQSTGEPWFSPRFGALEATLGGGLVLAGIMLHWRRSGALVVMTVVTMLVMQAVIFKGYCSSNSGQSDFKRFADLIAARYPDATFFNAHPKSKRPPTDLGVYLNRTIRLTTDPQSLHATEHPIVLFMLQNKGEPEPAPPDGWHFVDVTHRDKDLWWAFVLPPS